MPDQRSPSLAVLGDNPRASVARAVLLALATLCVYLATALAVRGGRPPHSVYYDELAHAFVHGRLHLENPSGVYDLTSYQDRWYVPFLPLPALVMLGWVALFGLANTNAVLFSVLFGALTVGFTSLMLDALARRGWIALPPFDRVWLCIMLALGSAYWYTAVESSVWYLAHTFTCTFVALAVWRGAASASPWPAAIALAIAMWARPNVILTWPLLLGFARQRHYDERGAVDRPRLARWIAASVVPPALSLAGLALYNYARFDNPFDFGYTRQNVSGSLIYDLAQYGQFSLHYVQRNLYYIFVGPPLWIADQPWPEPDPQGMSVFLVTPALLWLAWARDRRVFVTAAWLAVVLLLLPLVTYYNTGWRQFGYRFALDLIIPAIVLIAVAAGARMSLWLKSAIALGAAINAYGVWWWFVGALQ